ncbi:MAG TPA: hypothetical protein VJ233_03360 [Hyphomicrobiaceae bacterium]|nr:hypothetical protein [Hyphomicrobiaceae bacterium]
MTRLACVVDALRPSVQGGNLLTRHLPLLFTRQLFDEILVPRGTIDVALSRDRHGHQGKRNGGAETKPQHARLLRFTPPASRAVLSQNCTRVDRRLKRHVLSLMRELGFSRPRKPRVRLQSPSPVLPAQPRDITAAIRFLLPTVAFVAAHLVFIGSVVWLSIPG